MVRTANLMFAVLVVIALQSAMPAHVSAGRLKAEIIVIYQTCVGQELRLLARLTNENGDPVGTTTTRIEIRDFDDTQVLHTSSNDVRQIGGNAWEEFEMGSGWTPSDVGTYNVHLISDGENNDNGEQDFSFFTTICEGIQCPLRPTAEADNFYLDETGYASIRYLVEDGCCYRLKLTVIDPDGAVTVKVPEEWVNISGNYGVYVRVDRTKLTGRPIRAYVEFANCQGQNPGRDDDLIIEGDELAATAFVDLNSGYELINSGEDGDPVIMSSLEQRIGSTPDITMGGPGGIDLVRTYHSKIDQNGAVGGDFGPGWSHNHEWRIREATNSVYVYGPDNMLIKFRRVGDGLEPVDVDSYDPTRFRLRRAPEGGYRFTWIKNETETIGLSTDTDGRVRSLHRVRWVDGDFQEEVYYYTYENGVLKRIRTQDGRELNIDRNANNKISQLSTDDQQVTFEYSANVLNSVTDAVGLTTTYTTKPGTHYITNVVTPDGGSSMTINMDEDGSVVSHAIGENYTVEFTLSDDRSAVLYPGGLEKVFVHDDRANLQSVNLGDYGEATFNYGAFNRRTLINDFVDGETTIEFTDDGLKKRLTFDETNPVDFTYGQYGFDDFEYPAVDKIQVENGAGVTFARDEHGRHNSMTFSNGLRLILPRDVNGNMTQYSSVDGRTDIDHDELGRISGLHFFDGSAETMLYSSFGHLSKIDREGEDEDVEWSRDLKARLVKFREGEVTWDLTWTGDDQPESVTDGEGRTSQYQYDENRRLWKVTRGTTSPLSMELNWNGPYPTDLGRAHMTYNDFGWVSEYSPAPGSDIQLSYDGEGNINGVRLNGEYQWEIERNKRGLPMKYVLPDGRQTEFDWDGNNRLKNSKSADGILREYSSEPDGSGGTIIAPLGIKMSFGISFEDENTYTLKVTDPNGHDWSMTQHGDSGMRAFTSPLGSTQVNLYDPI